MSWESRSTSESWKSRSIFIKLTFIIIFYKIYDHHWMSISHTRWHKKNLSFVWEISKSCIWIESLWTWWKSDDFDQNMKNQSRFDFDFAYICWHERKFFVSMINFKKVHLNREIVNLMKIRKWWIEKSRTWWKWSLQSMLRNHLINVTRTHMNETLNIDDQGRYICI
jgi:hypothetical protein